MSIEQYGRLPILPAKTLRKFHVYEPADTRFRAAARLRQALWRQQMGWKPGYQRSANSKRRKIGNCVTTTVAQLGANFISAEIADLVRREIAYREDGALVDEARLTTNLLSSAPVVFNVFGALKLDLKLASRVFRKLFPDSIQSVADLLFEHAPYRGSSDFTADYTAFDLIVRYRAKKGGHGFIAIEVKYSETMMEPAARLRPRYDELSASSGCFKSPDAPELRASPLQQFWRQHMLAAAMLQNRLYTEGRFIVVGPRFNTQVQNAVASFRHHVVEQAPVQFDAIPLESIVDCICKAGATDTANALFDRYCNFAPINDLI